MKWTRYEILLPLYYNDGRPIEGQKFRQTNLELTERYSGTTADVITAVGTWKYRGDSLRRSPRAPYHRRFIFSSGGRFLPKLQGDFEGSLPKG